MATFRHGKGVRPLIDEKDMSDFLTDFTVSASMEAGETTTFRDSDRNYIRGLRDVTASFEGLFAAATSSTSDVVNYLDGALGGSTRFVVTVDVEGTTGGRALMMTGDMVGYDIDAPVDGIVGLSLDIQGSDGYRGGRMLRPLSLSATGTVSGTAVLTAGTTAAGGTTGGGLAHLHVTKTGSTKDLAIIVQHSTSGSTWANLISFTATTAATFQRSTVAGTVKEQLRVTKGSTSPAATYAVSFSRHGRSI